MKYILIILFLLGFSVQVFTTTNPANALLLSADPLGEVDVAVVGKIVSATPNYDTVETAYAAEIEEIIKGWDLLEEGNSTKSIQFNSPGIRDYDGSGHIYEKIFQMGDRALLMLNQRNDSLYESLWSRTTKSDCSGREIYQLHSAPSGLHLSQQSHEGSPLYTNKPIAAKFYYFNKELSNKTVNIEFVVIDDFPDVYHSENVPLSLKRCQPYAEASTEFIMSEPSTFAIRAIVGNNEGGSQSFSGIKVIDYILSPLKQLRSGIPINEIKCREEMVLITKSSDGSPACVTPETKEELIERGWAKSDGERTHLTPIIPELGKIGTYELQIGNKTYDIPYHIRGGSDIKELFLDENKIINVVLRQHDSGSLEVTLSRELLDAEIDEGVDGLFVVLIDGLEVPYSETASEKSLTLTIQFEKESEIIEIIGGVRKLSPD